LVPSSKRWLVRSTSERRTTGESSCCVARAAAGIGGSLLAGAGRAERGGITGHARRDAAGEDVVDEGADKASAVGGAADGPVAGRCVVGGWPAGDWPAGTAARARGLLPAGRAAAGRGLDMRPLPLPLPENAGSRVATATSRGANAATVEPGRALGNRRTWPRPRDRSSNRWRVPPRRPVPGRPYASRWSTTG
jgi:hypothetical protein